MVPHYEGAMPTPKGAKLHFTGVERTHLHQKPILEMKGGLDECIDLSDTAMKSTNAGTMVSQFV